MAVGRGACIQWSMVEKEVRLLRAQNLVVLLALALMRSYGASFFLACFCFCFLRLIPP